ncbi:MAG: HNH endonuclease [Candidatus Paceibacterota bacterium]
MTHYFLYNTDNVDQYHGLTGKDRRVHVLLNRGFAATGGERKFGEQLDALAPGDTLLMYENRTGVIAIGEVEEKWNQKSYSRPLYYPPPAPGLTEYRIRVNWDRKVAAALLDSPITLGQLRERFNSPDYTPRGIRSAVLRLKKHHGAVVELVAELRSTHSSINRCAETNDVVDSTNRHKDQPTTARREIDARLGQGQFRDDVIRRWGKCCAVTGATTRCAIRASHIKPWGDFPSIRLDPDNGIPLLATLDALFDKGLISFDDNGNMLISKQLGKKERQILGISRHDRISIPSRKTSRYLAWHRKKYGF